MSQSPTPFKAMILAAGLGNRMRPLTDHTPKPLLTVGGKPLIVWQIERLKQAGFTQLVINHAHLGQQLEDALGDGHAFGVHINWSREPHPLETAGGIATALPLLGAKPFVVTNGDVYIDFDYARLVPILQSMTHPPASQAEAHLVLVNNPPHHPEGDFVLQSGLVKPAEPGHPTTTFSGVGCYQPALFSGTPPMTQAKLAPLLRTAMANRQVTGQHFSGRWEDVGTPQRLAQLDEELRHANPATA